MHEQEPIKEQPKPAIQTETEKSDKLTAPDWFGLKNQSEVIEELKKIRAAIELMTAMTAEQLESLRGGYDALVSAESAQAGLNTELFDTQPPVWYRRLSPEWKDVIRNRLYILLGCYIKRRVGHIELDPVAGNQQIRIERDALDKMWKDMPGFSVALTTMFNDFFEIIKYTPPFAKKTEENKISLLKITPEGAENLQNFADYKQKTILALTDYLENEGKNLLKDKEKNPLAQDPKIAAEAAFSAAWNLIYVSNAIESADFGQYPPPNEENREKDIKYERDIKNTIIYAEQVRASFLPGMKARNKFIKEPTKGKRPEDVIGTDEAWLGNLGEYLAERARHGSKIQESLKNKLEPLAPERLFASFFDLVQFEETEEDKEGNKSKKKLSIAKKIIDAAWQSEIVEKHIERPQGKEESKKEGGKKPEVVYLCVPDKNMVNFSRLKQSELWGGYADSWDSAKKIYEVLGGKLSPIKEGVITWGQVASNALTKLRGTPLAPIYNTREIIIAMIAGAYGLTPGTDKAILLMPEETYDIDLNRILDNDRFFTNLPPGSKKYIREVFMGQDLDSVLGALISISPTNIRKRERRKAADELAKLTKNK